MFPPITSFIIVIAGEKKEIRLRKISLRDHIFCNSIFENEIVETLSILGGDVDNISRLVYHQIVEEDTHYFQAKDATATDEDGVKVKISLGGAKLLARYVDNTESFKDMMDAYQLCLLSGLPIVEEKKKPLAQETEK